MTGHFLCLVDRGPLKSPVWSFDDARALYTSNNKHAYKIVVAHAMHALGDGGGYGAHSGVFRAAS